MRMMCSMYSLVLPDACRAAGPNDQWQTTSPVQEVTEPFPGRHKILDQPNSVQRTLRLCDFAFRTRGRMREAALDKHLRIIANEFAVQIQHRRIPILADGWQIRQQPRFAGSGQRKAVLSSIPLRLTV
jgi:hypothetical protein